MSYAAAAARMDAEVDSRLGDSIFYQVAGEPLPETPIKAFIVFPNQGDEGSGEAYDELGAQKPRLKVSREQIPIVKMADRIWGGDADATMRLQDSRWHPTSKKPQVAGRYWIFEMERVG